MPSNPQGAITVPCSLFAGLNTELSAAGIPEGVSPANNDVAFVPGSVSQRPGAKKLLPAGIGSESIVYHKSYTKPNNDTETLLLTSGGSLYKESIYSNPGIATLLSSSVSRPGSYAQSVSAFGREYIAFSDGLHGLDVPRQYDGSTLSRVTQDGPGTLGVTITQQAQTKSISSIGPIATKTIATVTEYSTLVTVVTTTAHGLVPNDYVIVSCIDPIFSNYLQPIRVEQVNSPTSFSYSIGIPGITGVTSGTVYILKVTVTTTSPHGLVLGDNCTISGNSWALYNNATTYATGDTPSPISLQSFISGKPPASTAVLVSQVTKTVNFAANFADSTGSCGTNPSGTKTLGIYVTRAVGGNWVQLGSISVNSSGSFTFSSTGGAAQILYPGDQLYILTPTPQDSNFSDVGIIFVGNTPATANTPPMWQVTEVISPTQFIFVPVSDNVQTGTGGTLIVGGQISSGQHKMVMFLELYNGEQTEPSPPVSFSVNSGSRITVSGLPTVYSNVKSLNFAFTLSEGGDYFYIPVVPKGTSIYGISQPIGTSTVVLAGSSSATFDFSDTTLAAAIAIDRDGNNLFATKKLAPCLGFFNYASRLIAWGEPNFVTNLMNMGFDGGYNPSGIATGWSATGSVNFTLTGGYTVGQARFTGNGSLSQPAYQDAFGVPVLQPATSYRFRLWIGGGGSGEVIARLYSTTIGVLSQVAFNVSDGWHEGAMSPVTPSVIPTDAILQVSVTVTSGTVILDELYLIYNERPYRQEARISYVINPGGFDLITGLLGTESDPSPVQCFDIIRDVLYMHTSEGLHRTQDNQGGEPSTWMVKEVSRKVGALSFRSADAGKFGSGDTGEEWSFTVSRGGLYIFAGGALFKISQEIQTIWNRINMAVSHTIWMKNDTVARRVYIGVPLDDATAPNVMLVMDYRELETAHNIATASPIHISFTGRMIASDLTRKWTIWTIPTCSGELISRPGNKVSFTIGAGNGVIPGQEPAYGNIYEFKNDAYKDDDYGTIPSSYSTYFFINHEAEMSLGVGCYRKLFTFLSVFMSGIGQIQVTPAGDTLENAWPPLPSYPLSQSQNHDLMWGVNVLAERCSFTFRPLPLPDGTSYFNLQKMVVAMKPDPFMPVRGLV